MPDTAVRPTDQDAALARTSQQVLARFAQRKRPLTMRVKSAGQDRPVELPGPAVSVLLEVLAAMATGHSVTVLTSGAELSSAQAAQFLNVSRPFLIKLLDTGAIPHRKVGKHRRVKLEDLHTYRAKKAAEQDRILEQLTVEAQTHNMGYPRA